MKVIINEHQYNNLLKEQFFGGDIEDLKKNYLSTRIDKLINGISLNKEELTFNETLNLIGTNISFLPDNLHVKGNLLLKKSKINSLPNNLKVNGDLNLSNTKIESLPSDLYVGGSLDLAETHIKSLPEKLKIGRSIILIGSKIEHLPDNLVVNKDLNLQYTNIEKLPNKLKVYGYLDLTNTKISSIPYQLFVKRLTLHNTPLASKFSEPEIRQMIFDKGGSVKGRIGMPWGPRYNNNNKSETPIDTKNTTINLNNLSEEELIDIIRNTIDTLGDRLFKLISLYPKMTVNGLGIHIDNLTKNNVNFTYFKEDFDGKKYVVHRSFNFEDLNIDFIRELAEKMIQFS